MDYLVYISHDAENLQFWLWLQDYTYRFNAAPRSEQALSPPWSQEEAPQAAGNVESFKTDFELSFEAKDTPTLPPKPENQSYFSIPMDCPVSPYRVRAENKQLPDWQSTSPNLPPTFDKQSFVSSNIGTNRSAQDSVEEANHAMGLKWQSCTYHPNIGTHGSLIAPFSYDTTFPLRDQPSNFTLRRHGCSSRAQSVAQDSCCSPSCSTTYYSSLSLQAGKGDCRTHITWAISSEFHPLVHL